jgi:methionyl-tRNA formyltransferase
MGLFPAAHTSWRGKRLKLLSTEPLVARLAEQLSPEAKTALASNSGTAPAQPAAAVAPGTVLAVLTDTGLVVATGGCPVLVREAQLEGKAAARGGSLLQQLAAQPGDQLGFLGNNRQAPHEGP